MQIFLHAQLYSTIPEFCVTKGQNTLNRYRAADELPLPLHMQTGYSS